MMRVVILGAGVLGVATAYYLARDGVEVSVLERQGGPGRETSFANAAQVSAESAGPWFSPGMPRQALKWLMQRDAPFVLRWRSLDANLVAWLWRAWRNCSQRRFHHNRELTLRIARYSRDCLQALRRDTGIAYDEQTHGILQIFRAPADLDRFRAALRDLSAWGASYQELDRQGCLDAEPALAGARAPLSGGVLFPNDESGDCLLFTERLCEAAQAAGAQFHFGAVVTEAETAGGRLCAVRTQHERYPADAVVVAMGSYSGAFLDSLRVRMPICPVKGYTVTLPLKQTARPAPRVSVTDESRRVVISRLGDGLRAAGTADLAGFDTTVDRARCDLVQRVVEEWYPGLSEPAAITRWACLRPMTPDSLPLLGPSRYDNLFLNTGHGSLGWTMACGSARVVADYVIGKSPEIDVAGFAPSRFA